MSNKAEGPSDETAKPVHRRNVYPDVESWQKSVNEWAKRPNEPSRLELAVEALTAAVTDLVSEMRHARSNQIGHFAARAQDQRG